MEKKPGGTDKIKFHFPRPQLFIIVVVFAFVAVRAYVCHQ